MNFGLGAANFGSFYGSYQYKKFSNTDIKKIINISQKNKINYVDTAEDYRGSHKIIKKNFSNFLIISKIKVNQNNKNYEVDLKNRVVKLNKKFGSNLYAILIHNFDNLGIRAIKNSLNILKQAKDSRLIKKFGVSIYDPNKLKNLKNIRPDIIQAPLNVFDQRLLSTKILRKIKSQNIELHVRSCFLQGTLVQNKLPKHLQKYSKVFNQWMTLCRIYKISPLKGCIDFIKLHKKNIRFLIIGFNTIKQLDEIIKIYKTKNKINLSVYNKLKKKNIKIIDPRKWQK
tara:strand:+ start:2690 stop:3544 length:855 start_codon:yes stop_codon:yes gene_type:complete